MHYNYRSFLMWHSALLLLHLVFLTMTMKCVRLAYDLSMALELVKYQTIMVMLFTNHSPARCLEYDSLFRQAAAHDPTLRWDTIKEDIYVWAITQRHNTSTFQFQSNTSTFRD